MAMTISRVVSSFESLVMVFLTSSCISRFLVVAVVFLLRRQGYGDVTPTDPASRCFTALFALTGITVLGLVLGHMGSAILDAQEAAVEQAKKDHAATLERIFMTTGNSSSSSPVNNNLKQQTKDLTESTTTSNGDGGAMSSSSSPWSGWHLVWEFARCLLVLAIFAAILAANDPGVRDHGWRGALYYAIITATTVGYGDLAPTTQRGRLWAILLIPIAVAVMGHWISAVATYIMERRQMDNLRRKLLERDLQLADLTIMDENGDGQVSPLEFLRFMLVAMNKVDVRTLEQIQSYFAQLDVDGTGTLNKHDIIANAKKKLRQTNRKLELSAYKQRLIALGRRDGASGSGGGRQQQRPLAAAAGQLRQSLSQRWSR
jgi:potassium channel subfamily K, other eukaryote